MNRESKGIVYLSGPITGHEDHYRHDFRLAERLVEDAGFTVLNPSVLPDGLSQRDYMRISLAMLEAADTVVVIKGWSSSQGAQIEWAYAQKTDKRRMTLAQFCEENNVLSLPEDTEGGKHEQAG